MLPGQHLKRLTVAALVLNRVILQAVLMTWCCAVDTVANFLFFLG